MPQVGFHQILIHAVCSISAAAFQAVFLTGPGTESWALFTHAHQGLVRCSHTFPCGSLGGPWRLSHPGAVHPIPTWKLLLKWDRLFIYIHTYRYIHIYIYICFHIWTYPRIELLWQIYKQQGSFPILLDVKPRGMVVAKNGQWLPKI